VTVLFAVAMALLALAVGLSAFGARGRFGALCCAAGCVLLAVVGFSAALGGSAPVLHLGSWLGFGNSALRADGLAGIFLALTGITGAAVSFAYVGLPAGRWLAALHGALVFFVAVTIGATNGFLFLLAWEALTVCIYLIASAERTPEGVAGGYLTAGLAKVGGAALLAAFGLLYAHTHSFSLAAWSQASLPAGTRGVLFLLLLAGFATKVGVLPLQGGLPSGYASAPRLGAASLAVALCAGYYGLWRFEFDVLGRLPTWCGDALLVLAGLTAVFGIVYAVLQDDLRRFLGYSSVEHAGIALAGLGVALLGHSAGMPTLAAAGLLAATLQVCAHGLAKTLALISIDRVERASGQRRIDPLGGLSRRLPFSASGLGVASLTLLAIPPLGGVVSEWFIFQALLQGFRMPTLLSRLLCALTAAALALTAGIGLLAFAKYFSFIFLGRARTALGGVREPSRLPAGLIGLGLIVLTLGIVAPWEVHLLGAGLSGSLGFDPSTTAISHPLVLGPVFREFSVLAPTWLAIVLPVYTLLAFAIATATGRRTVRRAPVWVTGSGADIDAVQYRPSAYSNPMRVILRGPLGYRTRLVPGSTSGTLSERTTTVEPIERFLYRPLAAGALRVAALVRRTQSGRLSTYLLYMLIALLLALSLIPILH